MISRCCYIHVPSRTHMLHDRTCSWKSFWVLDFWAARIKITTELAQTKLFLRLKSYEKKSKPTYAICKYHYQCLIIFFLSAPLYHCQFLWKGSHRKPIETQSMRKSCTVFSSHKDLRTASTCRKSRKWNSSPSQWQLRKSNCLPWLGKGEARTYSHNFS